MILTQVFRLGNHGHSIAANAAMQEQIGTDCIFVATHASTETVRRKSHGFVS